MPDAESPQLSRRMLVLTGVLLASAVIASGSYYMLAEIRALGRLGFPLDDSWIHLQIARNLAEGHGFSFNPGVPTAGATAPLWSVLLTLPVLLGVPAVVGAKLTGLFWAVIAALAAAGLAWEATGSRVAMLGAGLAVSLSPTLTWGAVSGMEVPLYTALVLLALRAYVREWARGGSSWAWIAALAGTARPEAFILLPVLFLHRAITVRQAGAAPWRPWRAIGWGTAVVVPYALLNLRGGGTLLPSTFYAKSYGTGLLNGIVEWHGIEVLRGLTTYPFSTLNTLLLFVQGQSAMFFMAWLVGVLALSSLAFRRVARSSAASVIVLIFLAAPIAIGAIAPVPPLLVHNGRYIGYLVALFFVIGAAGLAALHREVARRWVVPVFLLLALARLGAQDAREAGRYVDMVRNIEDLQEPMGSWIAAHTGPDARIAVNDIGAVGFFSRRFIIDTEGLVTPDLIPFKRQENLLAYLERSRPDLLVIFPEWYPELSNRSDLFHEIHRIRVDKRVVSGGQTLVVYDTPWTRAEAVAR